MLESGAIHPGRSARGHLLALARASGIPRRRVDEVLGVTGPGAVASKRAGGFSLGITQRLGIAAALLGDPGVLLLDEPVNGLEEFTRRASGGWVEVRSPETSRLAQLLGEQGATAGPGPDGKGLAVRGISAAAVGDLAARHQIATRQPSLEEAFMELTKDTVDYRPHPAVTGTGARP